MMSGEEKKEGEAEADVDGEGDFAAVFLASIKKCHLLSGSYASTFPSNSLYTVLRTI